MQTKVQASSEGAQLRNKVSCRLAILPPGGHVSLRQEMQVWRGIVIRVWAGIGHSTITTQGPKDEGGRAAD